MKISKKLSFLVSYSLPLVIVASYSVGGPFWTFSGILYGYGIIPIIDEILGRDPHNVKKGEFDELTQDRYFDILVYSHVYIQYFLLFWGSYVLTFSDLTLIQTAGLILSLGVYASTIINVAHELGHRQRMLAQFHARLALLSVSYMHFVIEHNKGHHVRVATPHDPATSKKNQSVYNFWWQSVSGGFISAWNLEMKRLQRSRQSIWSIKNQLLWFIIFPPLFLIVLVLFYSFWSNHFQWIVGLYFIGQSVVAILTLECVNYIEHYGIIRLETSPGRYERINPLHSWNANHFLSNLLLFQLQRHSDHHAFASRPYQVLRHFDQSPQLPFGYPVMILISLIPPLWYQIMNPRLEAWQLNAYNSRQINEVTRQFA